MGNVPVNLLNPWNNKDISRRELGACASAGLAALLIGNLRDTAYASPASRTFTDSLGRRADIPGVIDAAIPMGGNRRKEDADER